MIFLFLFLFIFLKFDYLFVNSNSIIEQEVEEVQEEEKKPEIPLVDILTNINNWETDMAILFHSQWCIYCSQLTPSWNDIIRLLQTRKNLKIGYFDCENPLKNSDFCEELKIDRYPTIMFIGYGNFHQVNSLYPNIVRFEADIIPNALYDWIRFLSFTSRIHRTWDNFKEFTTSLWTGKRSDISTSSSTKENLKKLKLYEKEILLLQTKLEKYEILDVFDMLPNRGDVFGLLSRVSIETNSSILKAFIECISEYSVEYCKYASNEEYCKIVAECALNNMKFEKCRPDKCPFKDRGCRMTSSCLSNETLARYNAR